MNDLFEGVIGVGMMILMLLGTIGNLYWLWMAIHVGSFMMFVVGVVPLSWIVTAPTGAWSLLFGVPEWVVNMFG